MTYGIHGGMRGGFQGFGAGERGVNARQMDHNFGVADLDNNNRLDRGELIRAAHKAERSGQREVASVFRNLLEANQNGDVGGRRGVSRGDVRDVMGAAGSDRRINNADFDRVAGEGGGRFRGDDCHGGGRFHGGGADFFHGGAGGMQTVSTTTVTNTVGGFSPYMA